MLQRYLGLVIGRVGGFGGKPGQIPPSPSGNMPGHFRRRIIVVRTDFIEFTGKVVSLIYDRFGDFAGFRLLTEHGREHEFRGREEAVEALVKSAWIERSVISVHVEEHRREWPTSIVLRGSIERTKVQTAVGRRVSRMLTLASSPGGPG